MSRTLCVSRKWLSFKGEIRFTDEAGEPAYNATGEFAAMRPTWTFTRAGEVVARLRKKPGSWWLTWEVEGEAGVFEVQRKMWSWSRQYTVVGGGQDGARISGNFFDLKFEMRHGSRLLARSGGDLLTLQDRHLVEVLDGDELFVVIAMLVILLDRAQDTAFLAVN